MPLVNTMDLTLASTLYLVFLVFCRVGGALMIFPGIGGQFVPRRIRLSIAIMISIILTPLLASKLPEMPENLFTLVGLYLAEIMFGLFVGMVGKFVTASFETAGMIAANQMGLANASIFNPAMSTQGSLIGVFLGVIAMVLIFVLDLHHLILAALVNSYDFFKPGTGVNFADYSKIMVELVSHSFAMGVQIAAPFLVVGFLFFFTLGFLARLMPQVQFFFIAMPAQILLGLVLLLLVLSASMLFWVQQFEAAYLRYFSA